MTNESGIELLDRAEELGHLKKSAEVATPSILRCHGSSRRSSKGCTRTVAKKR